MELPILSTNDVFFLSISIYHLNKFTLLIPQHLSSFLCRIWHYWVLFCFYFFLILPWFGYFLLFILILLKLMSPLCNFFPLNLNVNIPQGFTFDSCLSCYTVIIVLPLLLWHPNIYLPMWSLTFAPGLGFQLSFSITPFLFLPSIVSSE